MRWFAPLCACLISIVAVAAPKAKPGKAPAKAAAPVSKNLDWVEIKGGEFHYGCEKGDKECKDLEMPGMDISQPGFSITRTEVTVEQYRGCVEAGQCAPVNGGQGGNCNWNEGGKERFPIACVDREMAQNFCAWAGGRLPKAIEWEFAAKGGGSRIYPWGNKPPDEKKAAFQLGDGSKEVGSHPEGASKDGLQDMAGNVWEWTADTWPSGHAEVRGGGWRNGADVIRNSRRGKFTATERADWVGFRCAK